MGNLIALNSTIFNLSRLIGPPIAGFLITLTGEWLCFLLNTGTFVVVIAALQAMRLPPRAAARDGEKMLDRSPISSRCLAKTKSIAWYG